MSPLSCSCTWAKRRPFGALWPSWRTPRLAAVFHLLVGVWFVQPFRAAQYLEGYYSESLARVQHDAEVFAGLVALRHADLGAHLADLGVHPLMYVTPWLMCVFTSLPCWDAVLAVWDVMLFKGVKTLHRTGLAIVDLCKKDLLSADSLGVLLPYLQRRPPPKVPACSRGSPASRCQA